MKTDYLWFHFAVSLSIILDAFQTTRIYFQKLKKRQSVLFYFELDCKSFIVNQGSVYD